MKGTLLGTKYVRRQNMSLLVAIAVLLTGATCLATDTGAKASGNWNDTATWTTSATPGSSDNVFIGSTYPSGSISTAAVTLTQNQSANYLYLGYSSLASGTLNLGDYKLTLAGTLYLGSYSGATATVNRGAGYLSATGINVNNSNSFAFGALDTAGNLTVINNSTATTAAAGNVAGYAYVYGGGRLTLGADMTLSSNLNVYDSTSTFDMANYALKANEFDFGYSGGTPALNNRGKLTIANLWVSNEAFNINATDAITNFYLKNGATTLNSSVSLLNLTSSATATTTTTGNVTGSATIDTGSHLTLATDMTLTGTLDLKATGSTFDMASSALTANYVYFGWNGTGAPVLQNRGRLHVANLYAANRPFDISSTDAITNFSLQNGAGTLNSSVSSLSLTTNATATTTAAGNVTGYASVSGGSRLTLGADMTLSSYLYVWDSTSTFDMANHALKANELDFGYGGGTPALNNRGKLTITNLWVSNEAFDINPTDSITNFNLKNGTSTLNASVATLNLTSSTIATTTATGSVTGGVTIDSGSHLTLGADMTLTGTLDLKAVTGCAFDMVGSSLNASYAYIGWNGGSVVPTLQNRGRLHVSNLYVANRPFDIAATDAITSFSLRNGTSTLNAPVSSLVLTTNATATTTAAGNVTGYASISGGSRLTLGADMTLSSYLYVWDSTSTFDMANYALKANEFDFGYNGGTPAINNRGKLTIANLWVSNETFNINAADSITNFYLANGTSTLSSSVATLSLTTNSTAATTPSGSVTAGVTIDSGSRLTLGADMTLSGTLDLKAVTGCALDMAGSALNASYAYIGWNGGSVVPVLQNRGRLHVTGLSVANQPFNINPTDTITNFSLKNGTSTLNSSVASLNLTTNATATTTAAGNVTGYVNVSGGSRLTLGADMTLSSYMYLWNAGSTLDMAGHALRASEIDFGWNGTGATSLINNGRISTNTLYVGNANTPTFYPGDSIASYINLSSASRLNVAQANYQINGLTFSGTYSGSLSINDTSALNLQPAPSPFTHWIFRWKNINSSSNWISTLTSLISSGKISLSTGYYLANQGGYTYIYSNRTSADFDWQGGDVGGPTDWSLIANWNPSAGTPYGAGVLLSLGSQPAGNNILDMGSSGKTVGGLVLASTTSTTIQSTGGYDLTLDNSGHVSTIDVAGTHFITTPVLLNNDLQIEGSGTLTVSGDISGSHNLDLLSNLVAKSIHVDTLTLEKGATLTLQAIPGGPTGNGITAVPEPSALVLLAIGSLGLFACASRQRRSCQGGSPANCLTPTN
jgi:fibronectin-binding autotransporter adhesin